MVRCTATATGECQCPVGLFSEWSAPWVAPLVGSHSFFFPSSPQARKSHTSQWRVHSDEKMRGDLMSVGGQVRKGVWGVGRGLYVPSCPSAFLARHCLTPAGEAGGSNGRCDEVFHWKPALGLWNNWKPGCPVSSGLILGGITGRAATDEEGRKIRVTETQCTYDSKPRPTFPLQVASSSPSVQH